VSLVNQHDPVTTAPLQHTLEARAKELAEEEADVAEQRVRFEAERLLTLYDELESIPVRSMQCPPA
jgi:dsDNA-specific endonuclease/ATPase MutS2